MAGAVAFAMMASYFFSRTLIPNMVHYMLRPELKLYAQGEHGETAGRHGPDLEDALRFQPAVRKNAHLLCGVAAIGFWTIARRSS